jgi:hypothetical protein
MILNHPKHTTETGHFSSCKSKEICAPLMSLCVVSNQTVSAFPNPYKTEAAPEGRGRGVGVLVRKQHDYALGANNGVIEANGAQ